MISLHKHLLTAGLLAGFGLAAVAQTPPPAAPAHPHMQQRHHADHAAHMQERRAKKQQRMQERREMRLVYLKHKLQITPTQEGAWAAWTAALQPRRIQRPDRGELRRMTTPQRIDTLRALRAARTAIRDQRGEATKAFYAALTAQQRQVFDEMGARMLRGGKGRGGRHRR